VTRAVVLGAIASLCALAAAAPASAAKRHLYAFDVLDARISEVMTFNTEDGPACQRAGLCGYSGTVTYEFGHADGFALVVTRGRRASGFGGVEMGGLTSATVQAPGGGAPCTDKVLERFDGFRVAGSPSRPLLVFHSADQAPQFLDTYCAGPRDLDVTRLIPPLPLRGSLSRRSLFAQTAGTQPFQAGPFVGTLSFSAAVRLRRSSLGGAFGGIFG
jgi:hypothetical protein